MTGEFGNRLMDLRYTSSRLWTELHKKQNFLKKPDSRSASQHSSISWYRGHFKGPSWRNSVPEAGTMN